MFRTTVKLELLEGTVHPALKVGKARTALIDATAGRLAYSVSLRVQTGPARLCGAQLLREIDDAGQANGDFCSRRCGA